MDWVGNLMQAEDNCPHNHLCIINWHEYLFNIWDMAREQCDWHIHTNKSKNKILTK